MAPTDPSPAELPDNVYDITEQRHAAVTRERRELPAFNDTTARALTHLVRCLRPAWSPEDVIAAVQACSELPLSEVIHAAVNLAVDSRVAHPSRLPHAGPHWAKSTEEMLRNRDTAAALAQARGVTGHRSHGVTFLTARCRAYLADCRDKGVTPDPLSLATYTAQGVDVEAVKADVYRD